MNSPLLRAFICNLNEIRPVFTPLAALFVNNKNTGEAHNIPGYNNNKIPAVLLKYPTVTEKSRNDQTNCAIASISCWDVLG